VEECSHLLVFCARKDAKPSIERYIKSSEMETLRPDFAKHMRSIEINNWSEEEFLNWSTNQAYIALGVGVTACADLRLGHCPMSGFVPADVHKVLELPANQWPVAYLAVGSTLDHPNPEIPKFRVSMEDLITHH
jgi:nitroreductase/dihydropteridine reductase